MYFRLLTICKIRLVTLVTGLFLLFFSVGLVRWCFAVESWHVYKADSDGVCYQLWAYSAYPTSGDISISLTVKDPPIGSMVQSPAQNLSCSRKYVVTDLKWQNQNTGSYTTFFSGNTLPFPGQFSCNSYPTIDQQFIAAGAYASCEQAIANKPEPPPPCEEQGPASVAAQCPFGGTYFCDTPQSELVVTCYPCDFAHDNDNDGLNHCADCDDNNATLTTQCMSDKQQGCPWE